MNPLPSRRGFTLAAAGASILLVLLPWLEAGGRPEAAVALDLVAHLLALGLVALWLAAPVGAPASGAAPLVPYVLIALFSAWQAPYAYAAGVVLFEMGTALALALALRGVCSDPESAWLRGALQQAWVMAALPAALLALFQVIARGGLRGAAGFVNPNHLGAYLACSLPLALVGWGHARQEGKRPRRLRAALRTAILAAGLLATGSRAALLAVLLAGLAVLLGAAARKSGRRIPARRLQAALALLFVFALLAAGSLVWRFARGPDPYRYDRLRIWPQALAMASEAPWVGVGPGQFAHKAPAYNFPRDDAPVRYGRVFRDPHSHLLLILAETGILGFTALGVGLWLAVGRERQRWREKFGEIDPIARASAWALGILLLISLFDEPLAHPPLLLAAAVLAALAVAPAAAPAPRPAIARALALTWIATIGLGGAILPALAQQASLSARSANPARRARGLERAARLNRWHAFYPGEEAALLLDRAVRPLDIVSFARIRSLADRAIRLAPEEAGFLLTRARLNRRACIELFRDASSCQASRRDYRRAEAAGPKDPRVHREAASFALLMGDRKEAEADLREAVALEPGYVRAWADLLALLEESRSPAGVEAVRQGLRQAREHAAAVEADSDYARDILAPPRAPAARVSRGKTAREVWCRHSS
ncbi:MAG: O-antigen ligase family protein [Acidobacteriota bacterium]